MVHVQKSQQGGGSPIIRGFEANKVLIVVDGVRMNNAIYRGGHLQDVITIDNTMLEKVEVSFGPGSVIYGSDALGGVMHFYTRNPKFSSTDKMLVEGGAMARFSSVNKEMTQNIHFNLGGKKWAYLFNANYIC
jgi:hemoglobin/transferrin/lactoferrin receptor protein